MASHTDLLPPELRAGWVYNRVLRSVGDSVNDEDQFPDGVPAEGEVVFEPDVSTVQVNTDGVGTTVVKDRITCKIHQGVNQPGDPDRTKAGLLIDPAGSVGGVYLSEGGWTATYHLLGASVPPVQFVLTEEHTKHSPLDIALVAGLTPSPTVKFVVNEQVYHDTLAARDEVRDALSSVQSDQDEIRHLLEYVQFNHIDEVYVGSDTPPESVSLWVDTTDGGKRVKSLVDGQWVDVIADVMRPLDADTLGGLSKEAFRKTSDPVDVTTPGLKSAMLNALHPVGSIYIDMGTDLTTCPIQRTLGGTWVREAGGRVLVGYAGDQPEHNAIGKTGGAKTHTLTVNEMPSHQHETIDPPQHGSKYPTFGEALSANEDNYQKLLGSAGYSAIATNAGIMKTSFSGSGQAHNNLQPYLTVNIWRRTA